MDGKSHLIDSVIQTSKDQGMITLDEALANLIKAGLVLFDDVRGYTTREEELLRLIG